MPILEAGILAGPPTDPEKSNAWRAGVTFYVMVSPVSGLGDLSMKMVLAFACMVGAICVAWRFPAWTAEAAPERHISITIDDLPANNANTMTGAAITAMTKQLVATLREHKIPAVGFVNERKLYFRWDEVNERIAALNLWLNAGLELGNHTYAHTSLNRAGLKEFEDSVIQGETVTRLLLAQHNMKLRYFRHPYLDTGRDLQTRREAEKFLVDRGYRIAPVTLDAWDWMFAVVYDDAKKRGDATLQQEVVKSYLSHTADVFAYCEKLSRDLIGYEPNQVLLLHASQLEADHIGEVLELIRKRGYRFITLEEALSDSAYGMPDTFVGEEGGTWLEHWAITRGQPPVGAPQAPQAMVDRANAIPHPQP
jgi:peptidoglycan-N-acetylglucosamine deacetylase